MGSLLVEMRESHWVASMVVPLGSMMVLPMVEQWEYLTAVDLAERMVGCWGNDLVEQKGRPKVGKTENRMADLSGYHLVDW